MYLILKGSEKKLPQSDSESTLEDVLQRIKMLTSRYTSHGVDESFADQRIQVLNRLMEAIQRHIAPLTEALSREGARPVSACELEVKRSIQTLEKTSQALQHMSSETRILDFSDALQGGHTGHPKHFTFGPLFAIVPFNFPLNLALHKIAPALALNLPFVAKMPTRNPDTYRILHKCLLEAGVPEESFLLLHTESKYVSNLLEQIPFPLISFTGSKKVGMELKQKFWDRKVILELGGTAVTVIAPDMSASDAEHHAEKIAKSAFGGSGQSCISLQHILVPESIHDSFVENLRLEAGKIAESRDRTQRETICGPMIDSAAYQKIEKLLEQAAAAGWEVWKAGKPIAYENYQPPCLVFRKNSTLSQNPSMDLSKSEAFGPVVCLHAYPDNTQAESLAEYVNGQFDANIHASVFSNSIHFPKSFFNHTNVRTLLWNEATSWRADEMPYGGSTTSAGAPNNWRTGLLGDEGPAQTLREYTMERLFLVP